MYLVQFSFAANYEAAEYCIGWNTELLSRKCLLSKLLFLISFFCHRSESPVPTIAMELISGAILVVFVAFYTTVDLGQQHDDLKVMANYNDWVNILKEKQYTLSLFGAHWGL